MLNQLVKRISFLIISAILFASISTQAFAAITNGSKCSKAGQTTTAAGKKLTCSLVWVVSPSKTAASAKPEPSKSKSNSMQSKSFRLESVSWNSDLGSAGAEARVTNTSRNTRSALMNITIFKSDGKTIDFTMTGSADSVSPGETTSVTFFSIAGDFPAGQFQYAFQVSTEF
jgi:hypothetical protein